MSRSAAHPSLAHRVTALLAIVLLLGQFIVPVVHQMTAHSHDAAVPVAAALSTAAPSLVSASDASATDHNPDTCSICQSIHQHRAGFTAPAVTAFLHPAASQIFSCRTESSAALIASLSSAPPRGPPAIA